MYKNLRNKQVKGKNVLVDRNQINGSRYKSEGKPIYDYVKKAYLGFLYLLTIAYLIKTVQT
ncbi:MAG: hypothetical protein E6K85_03790 [Thaumarchaeota archaeon]|nr:MAG: hypothetical protein E6K85_03790 [Nitrososphaerota archaeon]